MEKNRRYLFIYVKISMFTSFNMLWEQTIIIQFSIFYIPISLRTAEHLHGGET